MRCDDCIKIYKNESRRAYRRGESYRSCITCSAQMPPASGFTYCAACRAARAPKPRELRTAACPVCREPFETAQASKIYCSGLCRELCRKGRVPTEARREQWRRHRQHHIAAGTIKGRTGRPWRSMRKRVLAEEPDCWLCGYPIDPEVTWPDPLSGSVDHVQPLMYGGEPCDRNNLRAAHLSCNASRNRRQFRNL